VPGCVDQVELKVLPGPAGVWQGDGVTLDGDAPFTLEIHGVQDLIPEVPVAYEIGVLDEAICQGGFSVIDMSDDTEVAGLVHSSPSFTPEDRKASISGEHDHLSYSGKEVNQDDTQEFPHFFLSNFPSIVVTIWYGQSKLLGKPA